MSYTRALLLYFITLFSVAGNVFIRYLQMKEVFSKHNTADPSHRRLNIACLVVGFLSALGFSMVANFQVSLPHPSPAD